jgi:hypothetical protein
MPVVFEVVFGFGETFQSYAASSVEHRHFLNRDFPKEFVGVNPIPVFCLFLWDVFEVVSH